MGNGLKVYWLADQSKAPIMMASFIWVEKSANKTLDDSTSIAFSSRRHLPHIQTVFFFKIKRNIWKIYYCNKAVICLELFHNSGLFLALRMNVRAAGTNLPDAVQKTDINWSCSSPISLVLMILQSFSRTLRTRRKSKFFLCSTEV